MNRTLIAAFAALLATPVLAQTTPPATAPAPAPSTAPAEAPQAPAATGTDAVPPAAPMDTSAEPAPGDMTGTPPEIADSIERITYSCDGGSKLDVVYVNTGAGESYAVISQKDELVPMQVAVSGSGARYTPVNVNQTYELLTKGDEATLYEAQDKPIAENCKADM